MTPADIGRGPYGGLPPIALVALLAGLFFRFWDLGGAPLAVDEYFLGTSMLNTLERGLPEFACGGYYTRGVLIQYLSLPLLWLGLPIEFAVRFWPAVTSVLSIMAVWRLGLLSGGRTVAAIAVILTSLSLWEVEFGRFGRMYSPFQAIFLWYLYFQVRHLLNGDARAFWGYLAMSAAAIPTYEGAVMLLALNFLALVWRGKQWSTVQLVAAFALLTFGIAYNTVKFRPVSTEVAPEPAVPQTISAIDRLPITLPDIPDVAWPIVFAGTGLILALLWRYRSSFRSNHPAVIYWALPLVALGLGFVALSAGLLLVGFLMRLPIPLKQASVNRLPMVGWLFVLAPAWILIVAASGWAGGTALATGLKLAIKYVLNYPDVYYGIVRPWLLTIPVTTVALGVTTIPAVRIALRADHSGGDTPAETLRYVLAIMVLMCLMVAVLRQPYAITRYTYFIYPLLLVLAAAGIAHAATLCFAKIRIQHAFIACWIALLFLVTEDFRVGHLLEINEAPYRFRTAYDTNLATHYYPRWDYRSVANFVNARLAPDDSVIVFDQPFPHNLKRTSGIFIRRGTSIHYQVSTCGGKVDRWSNAPLLSVEEDVEEMIASTRGNVWLLARSAKYAWRDPFEIALETRPGAAPVFTSQDGQFVVYRIAAGRASR